MSIPKKISTAVKSFLQKIPLWRRPKPQEDPKPPLAVATDRQPGLDCPRCSFRMTIAMQMLLSGEPITCPSCRLQLHVDREKSKFCLQKLQELKSALDRAEASRKWGK